MSELILQSKFKRLKISCKKEGTKIIIGKPKTDKTTLFGLVLLPLVIAIFTAIFMIDSGYFYGKAIVFIIVLVGAAIFNFGRIGTKLGANSAIKILENNSLKISIDNKVKKFENNNIIDLFYEIKGITDDTYEGNFYLKDSEGIQYQILGFDDSDEKLLENDLVWFTNYFKNYLNLN